MSGIPITYLIIGLTAITSIAAFQNSDLINKLILYPLKVQRDKEYWRFITRGFIHSDWTHLIFNMFTLYFFGRIVESTFLVVYGNSYMFPLFYLAALVVSGLPSYAKHKDSYSFRSLGASGAVSAVVLASVLFYPWSKIYVFFIGVPGILYAIFYVWYSHRMSQENGDHINHDAHLHGALFGLIFPVVTKPYLAIDFIKHLSHPVF